MGEKIAGYLMNVYYTLAAIGYALLFYRLIYGGGPFDFPGLLP